MKTFFQASRDSLFKVIRDSILISCFLILMPHLLLSQILNGSFETNSGPTLADWSWTCGAESFPNAPTGGGNWCIKVLAGNSQGNCVNGLAYQKIPGITPGQNYELSGYEYSENTTAGIYFGSINNGVITYYSGAQVTDTNWTKVSIEATFPLEVGDTAIIILNCSTTQGIDIGYGYFDLISLKGPSSIPEVKNRTTINATPNPFNTSTILEINNIEDYSKTYIDIFSTNGKKAISLNVNNRLTEISKGNLSNGLYFILLRKDEKIIATTKLVVID